jgi:hypothetical protein
MKCISVLGCFAASALAACATGPREERVDTAAMAILDAHEKTGETVNCISASRIRQITPVTESKFLIDVGVRDYYLAEMNGRCSGATSMSNRLQYEVSGVGLCRNQIISVVENGGGGFQTGSCSVRSFEKLEKKAAPLQ